MSVLIFVESEGYKFSVWELYLMIMLLIVVGYEMIVNLIINMVLVFFENLN